MGSIVPDLISTDSKFPTTSTTIANSTVTTAFTAIVSIAVIVVNYSSSNFGLFRSVFVGFVVKCCSRVS